MSDSSSNHVPGPEDLVRALVEQGISDSRVLNAIADVRRELFVPVEYRDQAYANISLPIGFEQTISQPFIVAIMAQALELRPEDVVLEIGGGSGYAAAIMSKLAAKVYAIERQPALADRARANLSAAGVSNVQLYCRDGTEGLSEHAPYDAISIAAAARTIPSMLAEQLKVGGRIVLPMGETKDSQSLYQCVKTSADNYNRVNLCDVTFVPLIGEGGWQ